MIEPRKPVAAFDFNAAAGGSFMTPGGKDFVIRLMVLDVSFFSTSFSS